MDQHNSITTWLSNILGAGTIITAIIGIMPALAAAVAMTWYAIQVYESRTVQAWVRERRVRKIAKLKARLLMLETRPLPLPPGFTPPDEPSV